MAEETREEKNKRKGGTERKTSSEFAVLVGWVIGLTVVIAGIVSSGGVSGLSTFFNLASIFIVFGGLTAALIVNFGFRDVFSCFKVVLTSFKKETYNIEKTIDSFVDMAKKSRAQGLLVLEDDLQNIEDPFLHKGLKLAVDGYDENEIRVILERELECLQERHARGVDIVEKAGDYAPAWGMIGTLIGLILMLNNLNDPSTLGPSMAVAMLTTMYGAIVANLLAIPLAGKLIRNSEKEVFYKQLIIEGVLEIHRGQIPSKLKAKMNAYLYENHIKKAKKSRRNKKAQGGDSDER